MARNVRIIHSRDFVVAKSDGQLDLEASERLLRDLVETTDRLSEFDILLDTREATSTLSASDLWYLADKVARHPKTFGGRTAVLCSTGRFDHCAFFALRAEEKGVDMQAFTSYEDAMNWLHAPRTEPQSQENR